MKRPRIAALLASLAGIDRCHAWHGVDKARAAAFDSRPFADPLGQKTHACFVRRYDAGHLARHPTQKVSAMKPLVTAEDAPEDKRLDRAPLSECAEFVTDCRELAAVRHK